MIPQTHDRQVTSSGRQRKAKFGISRTQTTHVMRILRDTMYSDKVLAVLREYSSNAWDAHRMIGKADLPIEVTLPTMNTPTLVIRDFGPGLTGDQALYHFTQFGESTKRETDEAVGSLGVGCKAGHAYSDSFTVTSWCQGTKTIYFAVLDADDAGEMRVLYFAVMGKHAHSYLRQAANGSGMPKGADWDSDKLIPWATILATVPTEKGYWRDGYDAYVAAWTPDRDIEDDEPLDFNEWVQTDYWRWAGEQPVATFEEDEHGLEIKVPAKPADIHEFQTKARNLFRYMVPRPTINTYIPPVETRSFAQGFLSEDTYGWVGIMGCVPYRLDLSQVQEGLTELGLWDCLHDISGGVNFPIGAVQFNAGREELRYSDGTKDAILAQLKALVDEYVEDTLEALADDTLTDWAKRIKATYLARKLKLPLPGKYKDWGSEWVMLTTSTGPVPKHFRLSNKRGDTVSRLTISDNSRVIIKDDDRALSGYSFPEGCVVVSPYAKATEAEWKAELDTFIKAARVEGVPTALASSYAWYAPQASGRQANVKHRVSSFKLKDGHLSGGDKLSVNWQVVKRTPTDDDVFVVLYCFKAKQYGEGIYGMVQADRALAKAFGKPFPEIYGYKTTARKPVTKADCKGIHYSEWRKEFFKGCVTRKWIDLRRHDEWSTVIGEAPSAYYGYASEAKAKAKLQNAAYADALTTLKARLGSDHEITQLFEKMLEGRRECRKCRGDMDTCRQLWARIGKGNNRRTPPQIALDRIRETYPLTTILDHGDGLWDLFSVDHADRWFGYVKLIDAASSN